MKIVGIFMVKNEDIYIEQAIRNVVEFCDIIYVDDNQSSDQTPAILTRLAAEFDHIHVRTIEDTIESNENLVQYFDTDTWVFAVDGDELYDSEGLRRFRKRLESGEFSATWMIYGNCLHVTRFDKLSFEASGYLSPPSKSMTKLYNFSLISDFPVTDERLHGIPCFKDGGDAESKKLPLHEQIEWDNAEFRCAHMAFVVRTSAPKSETRILGMRLNPPQIYTLKKIWHDHHFFYALPRTANLLVKILIGKDYRHQQYQKGTLAKKTVTRFFRKAPNSIK